MAMLRARSRGAGQSRLGEEARGRSRGRGAPGDLREDVEVLVAVDIDEVVACERAKVDGGERERADEEGRSRREGDRPLDLA